MPKKSIALTFFYVLNILNYGSILVFLGIWPVIDYGIHPTDMPFGLFFTVFAVFIFFCALICGWATYSCLPQSLSPESTLLWILVPLFFAPFTSVFVAYGTAQATRPSGYFLYAFPVGFALPFLLVVAVIKIKNWDPRQR